MRRGADRGYYVLPVVVYVYGVHVHAGGHGLAGAYFGEVERGAEQLGAALVEHVLVLRGFDDALQLLNGGLVVPLRAALAAEGRGEQPGEPAEDEHGGGEQHGEYAHRQRDAQREAVGVFAGHHLRHGLAEYQHEHRRDGKSEERPRAAGREIVRERGGRHGGGDVGDAVPRAEGRQGEVEVPEDAERALDGLGPRAVLLRGLYPHAVGRGV